MAPDSIYGILHRECFTWKQRGRPGLAGRRRVLDSTPLHDAVATMDTVTLVRSAIRGLLRGV